MYVIIIEYAETPTQEKPARGRAGAQGGLARGRTILDVMPPERRQELARRAATARWAQVRAKKDEGDDMSLRLGALEDALINAGAERELARKAAEEVAAFERQLADVRGDLGVLKWMVGFLLRSASASSGSRSIISGRV